MRISDPHLPAIQFNQTLASKARETAAYGFKLQPQKAADFSVI